MDIILSRRSIKEYDDRIIPEQTIFELIRAGMAAPSANNRQPWRFIVIRDKSILCQIPKIHRYAQMLEQAGCAIIVCGDTAVQEREGYLVQDCAAATQNILLAAHAKGLGAVWLGVYPSQERIVGLRTLLNIPEEVFPISIVSVGYPAEIKESVDRFDLSKIHQNRW